MSDYDSVDRAESVNKGPMKKMDNAIKAIIKDVAKRPAGFKRRAYQAKIASDYFEGNSRKTTAGNGMGKSKR